MNSRDLIYAPVESVATNSSRGHPGLRWIWNNISRSKYEWNHTATGPGSLLRWWEDCLKVCLPAPNGQTVYHQEAYNALSATIHIMHPYRVTRERHRLSDFNGHPATTYQDVLAVVKHALENSV